MSPLYLRCGICGRRQADGILSRGHWGHVELAGKGTASACPTCKEANPDWEQRLSTSEAAPQAYGGSYRTA
jgi:hypothetical protein